MKIAFEILEGFCAIVGFIIIVGCIIGLVADWMITYKANRKNLEWYKNRVYQLETELKKTQP